MEVTSRQIKMELDDNGTFEYYSDELEIEVEFDKDIMRLTHLYVPKQNRRSGVAGETLRKIVDVGGDLDCKHLTAVVGATNCTAESSDECIMEDPTHEFMIKMGFSGIDFIESEDNILISGTMSL